MSEMFCFQCQQTAGGSGCVKTGVCGKQPETAHLQDALVCRLIRLAEVCQARQEYPPEVTRLLADGLFTTLTNVNFDNEAIRAFTDRVDEALRRHGGSSGSGDTTWLWRGETDTVSLRATLLFGLKGMAAYAHHALRLGYRDKHVDEWFYKGLAALAQEYSVEEWLALIMEFGQVNFQCMALLDRANTESFGDPVPTRVNIDVKKGPFIVVSGHDLEDLHQLLEQAAGTGVNVYTHCEMLPAHGYPGLKKYPHLAGNFGTAWQNQQKEFADIPAPVLFTTNCLMPPRPSYADRVYTTSVVGYEGLRHIEADGQGRKDFSPLIQQALALGGYDTDQSMSGVNGGHMLTTGFAHAAVLSQAPQIIDAIKSGAVKHLSGGRLRRRPPRPQLLHRVRQAHPHGFAGADAGLRQIPLQRSGSGRDRRYPPHSGRRPVQRRLQRRADRAGAGRRLRLYRQRPAADAGAVLVRAEGRVHPAEPAGVGGEEHLSWPHPPRLFVGNGGENAGGCLRTSARHRAPAGSGRHPAPRLTLQ